MIQPCFHAKKHIRRDECARGTTLILIAARKQQSSLDNGLGSPATDTRFPIAAHKAGSSHLTEKPCSRGLLLCTAFLVPIPLINAWNMDFIMVNKITDYAAFVNLRHLQTAARYGSL